MDPGVADFGGAIGNAGKFTEEPFGKLDDGAVLNKHPAKLPEDVRVADTNVRGDFFCDGKLQDGFEHFEASFIRAQFDCLPRGLVVSQAVESQGNVMIAWSSIDRFLAKRGDEAGRRDLFRRVFLPTFFDGNEFNIRCL